MQMLELLEFNSLEITATDKCDATGQGHHDINKDKCSN